MKRNNITCAMRDIRRLSSKRNGYVTRDVDDEICIAWIPVEGCYQYLTSMTSRDARLLAKRINEFLDAGG